MNDASDPPSIETLRSTLDDDTGDAAVSCLERYRRADSTDRKAALRALRDRVETGSSVPTPVLPALEPFLVDEDRSVRLTTAKLFVALAWSHPVEVVELADALAGRLADEDEFYYVRARSAEALGYVALERPDEVATPEVLADLRIGLSFDEPEVREKLAKTLAYIALGDPGRLRHHVPKLAEHLDSADELVRYHLCTALVTVGCEHPDALAGEVDRLRERLADDCAYVRGRAAEALGLLARSSVAPPLPEARLSAMADDDPFAAERARFALAAAESRTAAADTGGRVGTLEPIRERTDEIVEELTTPDGVECSRCGLALPDGGPPLCPRCGAPR